MAKILEEDDDDDSSESEERNKLKPSVFCIIATEFCERFSFCGLRTILSLYLRNELLVHEHAATIIYHVFIMLCYLVPFVGAVLADSILGRYKTIFYFSIVYLFGNVLTSIAAIPYMYLPPLSFTLIGLILIAIGTGGIKPCVAAFGGDQFILPNEERGLQSFFSTFYFAINLGGLVGMIVMPILRKAVTCYGEDTCYALGFGFPAVLMLLALIMFVSGKKWYKIKKPKSAVVHQFFSCSVRAFVNRIKTKRKERNKEHWLDYANEDDTKLIHDMKIVYAIMWLYLPLPLFWSLFDQQGSRWTFQASRTNGTVWYTGYQVLADQVQVINPAIVLIMIPVFEHIIYPRLKYEPKSSLYRMIFGGIFAGAAFLASGILELQLEKTYPVIPGNGHAAVNVINTLPCKILVTSNQYKIWIDYGEMVNFRHTVENNFSNYKYMIEAPRDCKGLKLLRNFKSVLVTLGETQVNTIITGMQDNTSINAYVTAPVDYSKALSGNPRIRIAYIHGANDIKNVTVTLRSEAEDIADVFFVSDFSSELFSLSQYVDLTPGFYGYIVASTFDFIRDEGRILLELGGVYTLVLREFRGAVAFSKLYTMTKPNTVHMIWLVPQYFLISVGEIMFAISGLEFSFKQAPKSMKTIIIAGWYLSVALGNFLVILVTQARIFKSQAHEFFLFAILITLDMALFAKMSEQYEYVELEPDSSESERTRSIDDEMTPLLAR